MIVDILIVTTLIVLVFFAARYIDKTKKAGGCAGCSKSCGSSKVNCNKK